MATLGDIRTLVRDRLDEATPRRWTNDQLNRWINEGARDVARRSECLHANGTVPVSSGVQQVSLATLTDIIRINRVEWKTTGESTIHSLEYRDFNNLDAVWWDQQAITRSKPSYFTLTGYPPALTAVLYPTPSSAGSLKVWYWKIPPNVTTDNATVQIPSGWEDTIADYAEYKALRKDADPRWKEAFEIYKDNLGAIVEMTRRYSDQNTVITPEVPHLASWVWDDSWGY